MRDKYLRQAVLDELTWEPKVDAAQIVVTVKHGIVTLTGGVGTYAEKFAAVDTAWLAPGVTHVEDRLAVI